MLDPLRAPGLLAPGLDHGFARPGEDVPPAYRAGRARQVHGTRALWVDAETPSPAGEGDALLTATRGVAVAIATADCVPLLVAAPDAGIVAAVHAGWRGTLDGIAPAVVRELGERRGVPAASLRIAIGPAIGGCCFEIEREIGGRFASRHGAAMWQAWRDRPLRDGVARGTLDLRDVNRRLLVAAGVAEAAIEVVGACTFCGAGGFASYRRDGANAGRQLSWIALSPRP